MRGSRKGAEGSIRKLLQRNKTSGEMQLIDEVSKGRGGGGGIGGGP